MSEQAQYSAKMWPFRDKAVKLLDEPERVVDRSAALLDELRELDAQLADLNASALRLRRRYTLRINAFGQITSMQCDLRECFPIS